MHKALENELALHQYETRQDAVKLVKLLHPEFIEIGYSGKTHSYESTLQSLLQEEPSSYKIWSQDFECIELAENLMLLVYREARLKSGILSHHTKRSSIWVKIGDNWQIKFHQATPVDPFPKLGG